MKLLSIRPHSSIANYVSNIVVLQDDNFYEEWVIPLIAKGAPSIAFQVTGRASGKNKETDSLVLYGQNIKPFEFRAFGHLTIIAYFLYPHILKTFFGFDANEATDLSVDLSLLQPARAINLKEQLVNATSLDIRLQLINNYILRLADLARTDINNSILFATKSIQKSNGLMPLRSIQNELRVTERTFQRLFEFHVGVSPKTFSRICQFHSAFQQLENGQFHKLGDIAYENGYADQSHLIRAFKEFTNYSPGEYLKLSSAFRE